VHARAQSEQLQTQDSARSVMLGATPLQGGRSKSGNLGGALNETPEEGAAPMLPLRGRGWVDSLAAGPAASSSSSHHLSALDVEGGAGAGPSVLRGRWHRPARLLRLLCCRVCKHFLFCSSSCLNACLPCGDDPG
jgi:hypothetical protein